MQPMTLIDAICSLVGLFFDSALFACSWLGWFTPTAYDLQHTIFVLMTLLGFHTNIPMG